MPRDSGISAAAFTSEERLLLTFSFQGTCVLRRTADWEVLATKQVESPVKHEFIWAKFFNNGRYLWVVPPPDRKRTLWDLSACLSEFQNARSE